METFLNMRNELCIKIPVPPGIICSAAETTGGLFASDLNRIDIEITVPNNSKEYQLKYMDISDIRP